MPGKAFKKGGGMLVRPRKPVLKDSVMTVSINLYYYLLLVLFKMCKQYLYCSLTGYLTGIISFSLGIMECNRVGSWKYGKELRVFW